MGDSFYKTLSFIADQEVDRTPDGPAASSGLQHTIDKLKHRATLTVRELQQAQQELWAIRGAAPAGHSPFDLEQDLLAMKKRVNKPILYLLY